MFKELTVKNFRSMKDVKLENIGSINLITGGNGCGKSTVLEAIFLNAGATNTALSLTLNGLRGDDEISHENDLVFHSLFNDFDATKEINIVANTINPNKKLYRRNLTIIPQLKQKLTSGETGVDVFLKGLDFKYGSKLLNAKKEKLSKGHIYFGDDIKKNIFDQSKANEKEILNCRYISPMAPAIRDVSERISAVIKDKQEDVLIRLLQIIDPRITKISTISEKGRNQIYVDIGMDKLMSATYMGGGFIRLLNLAISLTNDTIVLIDEIENGLHYTTHIPLLEFIFDSASRLKKQIFITTHSDEFLDKFITVMRSNKNVDVSAYRCFLQDQSLKINPYNSKELGLREQLDIELR
jgi:AAA15 family ATPase/GTPase